MEVLTSIMLMSVFTVVALTSMGTVVDDARFNQTLRELEQIRNGLTGETQRLETGLRKNYGYLGDLGRLPTSAQGLAALTSAPTGVTLWSANAPTQMPTYGVAFGWKGPYVFTTAQQDYTTDAWGNAYVYEDYPNPGDDGKRIRSLGSDGAVGGTGYAQEIDLIIPEAVINGRVLGYVVQPDNSVMGADQEAFDGTATATLHYGDGTGATMSSTTAAFTDGKYTFNDIPLGYASLEVNITAPAAAVATLGPSIVEVNKASTAALPVARATSSIYGNVPMCTEPNDIAIIPTNRDSDIPRGGYPVGSSPQVYWWNNTSRSIRIRIQIPDQTLSTLDISDPFYHENEYSLNAGTFGGLLNLREIQVELLEDDGDVADGIRDDLSVDPGYAADLARGTYRFDGVAAPGGSLIKGLAYSASIPARRNLTLNDSDGVGAVELSFLENRRYDIIFVYEPAGPAWTAGVIPLNNSPAFVPTYNNPNFLEPYNFYYRLGCKFFSAQSVVTGDL